MADAYWRGNDSRQPPPALSRHASKRPRSDYEMPSALDISSFYAHEDEREGHQVFRDTESINASYDRYLRSAQISTYGGESGRSMSGGHGGHRRVEDSRGMAMMGSDPVLAAKSRTMGHHHVEDPRGMAMVGSDPVLASKGRAMGVVGKPEIPLPPDASSTLFVEGLPANCTRREVAHIFRPFVGYKEVRLVTKESRHSGGDPLVLCFVDFQSPAHSATAMDALQGYKFDELERDSNHLRLQFARYPGAKSGGGHRGKR